MERLRLRRLELFYRSRQYAGNYLIGTGVAVLVALCVGCPIYDAEAQTSDATDDGTLTVEECLGNTNASIDPIAEDLIEQGIIAEDLLPTKVTNSMCEDMLEQAADGTPVGRLVAAQNYVQDIKLIEYTIRQAKGEAAAKGSDAKGSDHHFLADKPLALPRWTVLGATQRAAVAQYSPPSPTTSGGGAAPGGGGAAPGGGGAAPPAGGGGASPPAAGGGAAPGGSGYGMGVAATPRAATADRIAAEVVAEGDASIADTLDQIEAALIAKGTPRFEAVATARCSLETALLNATINKISRGKSIEVRPDPAPSEMVNGDTIPVTLVVSGAIREVYEKLEGQYEEVAEASEANDGCPVLTSSMEGKLYDHRFAVNLRQGQLRRPIVSHEITWRWDLTAITEGKNRMYILWGYELKHGELELRPKSTIPLHATITVKAEPVAKVSNSIERNWRWLLPVGIILVVAAAWLVRPFSKREQRRPPSEPGHEG